MVAVIRALGLGESVTVEALAQRTGVSGRTVREIVSAADGVDFLLGGEGNGYQLADTPADARRLSARLGSQAARMQARLARRTAYEGANL